MTVDDVFEALSDPCRRQLLLSLLEHSPQDDDRDPLNVVSGDVEPAVLETELVHNHLPKLESMGFIRWDPETNRIGRGHNWGDVAPVLTLIDEHQDELPGSWL